MWSFIGKKKITRQDFYCFVYWLIVFAKICIFAIGYCIYLLKKKQLKFLLYNIFIWCSGSDTIALQHCSNKTRKIHAMIGATIFFTAICAFISSSYAFYKVFYFDDSKSISKFALTISILFGLLWGLMIFNLDRLIVTSMKKNVWYKQLLLAFPRIVLAIVISFTIAVPLEIKLHENIISGELFNLKNKGISNYLKNDSVLYQTQTNHLNKSLSSKDSISNLNYDSIPIIKNIDKEIKTLKREYNVLSANIDPQVNAIQGQIRIIKSKMDTFTIINHAYNELHRQSYLLSEQVKNLKAPLVENLKKEKLNQNKINNLIHDEKYQNKIKIHKCDSLIGKYNAEASSTNQIINKKKDTSNIVYSRVFSENLLSQFYALQSFVNSTDNISNTSYWAVWFIRFLIIIIETAPIFVKLMISKCDYDKIIKEIKNKKIKKYLENEPDIESEEATDKRWSISNYFDEYTFIFFAVIFTIILFYLLNKLGINNDIVNFVVSLFFGVIGLFFAIYLENKKRIKNGN